MTVYELSKHNKFIAILILVFEARKSVKPEKGAFTDTD